MIMVSAHHVSYRKKGKGHVQQGAKAGDGNAEFYINRTFVNMLLGFVYEEDDPENLSKLLEMARKKALFYVPWMFHRFQGCTPRWEC
jgi:23S rRNA maturation mini-RNase III